MDKRTAQRKLLLHTPRKCPGQTILERFQLTVNRFNEFIVGINGSAEDRSKKFKILLYGKILVERKATGHVSHLRTYLPVVINNI
jgi:hypothetical protein